MSPRLLSALLGLLAGSALAAPLVVLPRAVPALEAPAGEEAAQTSAPVRVPGNIPNGYVFSDPRLLTQQLLWGLLHGVRLLGARCQAEGHAAAGEAYVDWLERQREPICAAERDLARHYFQRDTASPEALGAALGLKPGLDVDAATLAAACATLPQALKQDRYDLGKFYADSRAAIEKGDPDFPGAHWDRTGEDDPPCHRAEPPEPPSAGLPERPSEQTSEQQ